MADLSNQNTVFTGLCVPPDLSGYDQWVLWRYEVRSEKKTKVPYTVQGRRASSTNPADWAAFDVALNVLRRYPKGYSGLGFVFAASDPFAGIDLDDSLDAAGNPKQWARGIIEAFGDTYMEISPSRTGIKIWARGALPSAVKTPIGDGCMELYASGRYFTVTGIAFRGAPLQVEDHAADLRYLWDWARAGRQKAWSSEPQPNGQIRHGTINNTLTSIAGTLARRRVCFEAIEACLHKMLDYQCVPPVNKQEATRIARKAATQWTPEGKRGK